MGYFEIGVVNGKFEANIGTLWRSAYQLGASGIFTIGSRYKHSKSDTTKAERHIALRQYVDFAEFVRLMPADVSLVGIEMGGRVLSCFTHPKSCIYLLGAEDTGLSDEVLSACHLTVEIDSVRQPSFNVAVAGSIVMWDRLSKTLN